MNSSSDDEILNRFYRGIINNLDEAALMDVCRALGLDYAQLPGRGRNSKVWLFLEHLKDDGRLPTLLSILKQKKPSVEWDELMSGGFTGTLPSPGKETGTTLRNPYVIAAAITAAMALIVALVNNYGSFRTTNLPIEATQTAEARLTMVSTLSLNASQGNAVLPGPGLSTTLASDTSIPTSTPKIVTASPQSTETHPALLPAMTVIGVSDTPPPPQIPAPESEVRVIEKGAANVFFNGELVIAVYDASTQARRTTFGISAPGFSEEMRQDQTVTDRYSYTQNGTFEVTVTGFQPYSDAAEFTVSRLQPPARPVPTWEAVSVCKGDTAMAFDQSLIVGVTKASQDTNQVSFDIFAPGKNTLRVENQPVGTKFSYPEAGNYEIQIMRIAYYSECVDFYIYRLP